MKNSISGSRSIASKWFLLSTVTLGMVLVTVCASSGSTAARGYEVRVRYAEVTGIERVRMPSAAPAGAVVGGFAGLVLSRNSSTGKQIASGIGGAALGGLATKALEDLVEKFASAHDQGTQTANP